MSSQGKIKLKLKTNQQQSQSQSQSQSQIHLIDLNTFNKGHNDDLIEIIEKLIEYTEKKSKTESKEKFRLSALKKAVSSIRDCDFKITSGKQAMQLESIGKGIAERIDEFLATGTIKELNNELDPKTILSNELQSIHGIGSVKAEEFIKLGIKSVNELKTLVNNKTIKVIHSIEIGLKYYDDFKLKIPYEEIVDIYKNIESVVYKYYPDVIMNVCGSHRRKKALSGDIDILITHKNSQFKKELQNIIKYLTDYGILIDHLTSLGQTKYMGVCKHPLINIGRRIDIRFIDFDSYYYALLYFTGSVNINKKMRLIALQRGLTLNEYSLENILTKEKFIVNSEKEIFDILECKYLTPENRNL
jgi:DNA polymerase beta